MGVQQLSLVCLPFAGNGARLLAYKMQSGVDVSIYPTWDGAMFDEQLRDVER
ncbi:hypothetical protein DFR70_12033 [Nocardia tenerifensis]|uniref:Uncharacterized protein n=1 Tax=Nocardia tenerifensis TaxID=228006 RepID=A0A318JTW8_9NOCA|nr:hypothetical protein DFR70_12033 [Nocardia tenerifensis]